MQLTIAIIQQDYSNHHTGQLPPGMLSDNLSASPSDEFYFLKRGVAALQKMNLRFCEIHDPYGSSRNNSTLSRQNNISPPMDRELNKTERFV
jgi:hypothetical protein